MARPSGAVTFLFTDLEGSARLWEADAEAMRMALAAHDEMLRAVVDAHAGDHDLLDIDGSSKAGRGRCAR